MGEHDCNVDDSDGNATKKVIKSENILFLYAEFANVLVNVNDVDEANVV